MLFFFFFQAEDGIRDYKVTGVQTCALPIYCEHGIPTAKCGQSGGEHEQGERGRWLLPIRHPPAGQGTGWPPSGGFGSLRTTTMVNLETSAEIAPIAARSGARMAPTAAIVTGISTNVLPCSSFTTMRCTLPSWIRSRTLSTRSRPRT